MSLCDEFISFPMLRAFGFAFRQGKVLVSNNEQCDFLADASLDRDAGACGNGGRFGAGKGQFSGEAGDMAEQWACFVTLCRWRFFKRLCCTFGFVLRGGYAPKILPAFDLGHQNNLCGCFGVLGGIVVLEVEIKGRFQVGQAVSAVTFELRPGVLCNFNAVVPFGKKRWQAIAFAGAIDGTFVKLAMLNEGVPIEEVAKCLNDFGKVWMAFNHSLVDAVQFDIEVGKLHFRVDQKAQRLNLTAIGYQCQPELTNTGCISVCGFDVDGDKSKGLFQHVVSGYCGLFGQCCHRFSWLVVLIVQAWAFIPTFCRDFDDEKDNASCGDQYCNGHSGIQFAQNRRLNPSRISLFVSTLGCVWCDLDMLTDLAVPVFFGAQLGQAA
jgi:hypothetical protein